MNKIEDLEFKKAKTRKGKQILKSREPKLEEGPKKTLFLKGNKTSEKSTSAMQNLYLMKRANSIYLNERWEIRPFETQSKLEHICNKKDCGLFVFGLNSKKRPDALYIGRVYNEKILDVAEFQVESVSNMDSTIDLLPQERPGIIFQGDYFDYEANFMRLKNLFGDLFIENIHLNKISIQDGIRHFVVITADSETNKLMITQYHLNFKIGEIVDGDVELDKIATEVGPKMVLSFKRSTFASEDDFKKACKQPKAKKEKHEKNLSTNKLGEKRGRLFVDRQNVDHMALKKRKKLKRSVDGKGKSEEKAPVEQFDEAE